jgi:hypothetical protein
MALLYLCIFLPIIINLQWFLEVKTCEGEGVKLALWSEEFGKNEDSFLKSTSRYSGKTCLI